MTFAELVAEVITLTNRPDLQPETEVAVRKATLKMHQFDFFKKDIKEQVFILPEASDGYKFALNTIDELERFRAFAYVRVYNDEWTGTEIYFEEVMPDDLFDNYHEEKTNCYYRAGSIVNFKSALPITKIVCGWYQYPVVTPVANYDSWIAQDMPYAIIDEAASTVFNTIDQAAVASKYQGMAREEMVLLQINNTEGTAR